ncbi:sigma-54-dependent Fis family transcriptional regulator [Halanaerobium sp. MA284_MarDTE_T2]|uniref:sigma-54 interaction domain-containing protein n=1 Tax=Halanaerobium sp. MA284_MarDTE_T2 TaxID=2183913 RepID=UPI000DF13063|nr:sigma 54-interacting transcriptional regulator [Halanaerobium sp. MA284_MarDTE_T2]RCW41713.1 arginine utilization regulatory protein [Halanaerobium sp. MA284_MarDTE_T2]
MLANDKVFSNIQPELFKLTLDQFPGPILIFNLDNKIIYANCRAVNIFKIKHKFTEKDKFYEINKNKKIIDIIKHPKNKLNKIEYLNNKKIIINKIPLYNNQNETVASAGIIQELNDFKAEKLNLELENNKKLKRNLETILNSIDEGIHVINDKGKTIFYNKKMAELENQKVEEVLNKNLLNVFPELSEKNSTLMKTLKTKEKSPLKQQTYINYKNETVTTINETIPIKLDEKFIGALEIAKDITELKKLYEQVLEFKTESYEKEEQKKLNNGTSYCFSDIIGEDPALKEIISYAKRAAKTSSAILISGETGTGKELLAQSIHNKSKRSDKPFIAQNCAALPANLLESILFGTQKGAFTGAIDRKGLFQRAEGGTLLLDEINSMPKELQAKLLRVLQEKIIRPVGGKKGTEVDVRIMATINKHPLEILEKNEIRQDLYYRLAVVNLHLPPLRERKEDIPILVGHFINKFNKKFNYNIKGITDNVEKIFIDYHWPGGIRQLEHVIEGAVNLVGMKGVIKEKDIKPFLLNYNLENKKAQNRIINFDKVTGTEPLTDIMKRMEKNIIKTALDKTNRNITQAAENIGISRQSLRYKMDKYDLA